MKALAELTSRWQLPLLDRRNSDFGPIALVDSHPRLRRWRLLQQVHDGKLSHSEMLQLLDLPIIAGGSTVLTPSWTQNPSAVVSLQTLALANNASGTIDLTAKWGAYTYLFAGKQATTAQATGLTWYVRRKQNTTVGVPVGPWFVGDTTAATFYQALAGSGNSAASASLVLGANTFTVGDVIFVDDTGNVGLANSEWFIATHVSTVTISIDKNGGLEFAHNSTSAHASNHADVFTCWLDGGSIWEIVAANVAATGSTDAVRALVETFDSVSGT